MKYGYLFYRKPLRPEKKERPMNLGDPIQSLAAINLFREMGISEENIIPVESYDTANYKNEELILCVNGAYTSYHEYFCYPTAFFPFASKIKPVFISFHFHRQAREDEIVFFRKCGPIGCRDEATLLFMREQGIEAYLTGCLTLTFPRREETEHQNKVFLVDCPSRLLDIIPMELRENAISLTQIVRVNSISKDNRITKIEAENFHRIAYEQLWRLRDEAKLVITSRLHVATPCLAMGIPVILAENHSFEARFDFIDKFLPLYTRNQYHEIDWHPKPQNIECEKALVKECFFSGVRAALARIQISTMYEGRKRQTIYSDGIAAALFNIPLPKGKPFRYAIWGVCIHATFLLHDEIIRSFPESKLVNAIDTNATGQVIGVDIIHPNQIANLDKEVVIFVTAPSAHEPAKQFLENTGRPFALIKDIDTEAFNFDSLKPNNQSAERSL